MLRITNRFQFLTKFFFKTLNKEKIFSNVISMTQILLKCHSHKTDIKKQHHTVHEKKKKKPSDKIQKKNESNF